MGLSHLNSTRLWPESLNVTSQEEHFVQSVSSWLHHAWQTFRLKRDRLQDDSSILSGTCAKISAQATTCSL